MKQGSSPGHCAQSDHSSWKRSVSKILCVHTRAKFSRETFESYWQNEKLKNSHAHFIGPRSRREGSAYAMSMTCKKLHQLKRLRRSIERWGFPHVSVIFPSHSLTRVKEFIRHASVKMCVCCVWTAVLRNKTAVCMPPWPWESCQHFHEYDTANQPVSGCYTLCLYSATVVPHIPAPDIPCMPDLTWHTCSIMHGQSSIYAVNSHTLLLTNSVRPTNHLRCNSSVSSIAVLLHPALHKPRGTHCT